MRQARESTSQSVPCLANHHCGQLEYHPAGEVGSQRGAPIPEWSHQWVRMYVDMIYQLLTGIGEGMLPGVHELPRPSGLWGPEETFQPRCARADGSQTVGVCSVCSTSPLTLLSIPSISSVQLAVRRARKVTGSFSPRYHGKFPTLQHNSTRRHCLCLLHELVAHTDTHFNKPHTHLVVHSGGLSVSWPSFPNLSIYVLVPIGLRKQC